MKQRLQSLKTTLKSSFIAQNKAIKGIAAALFLSLSLYLFTWSGEHLLIVADSPEKADVIVVLGYPADADGSPNPLMRRRVDKGIELFQQGYAPRILFSGAAVQNKFVEAEVMAAYARDLGLPTEAVLLDKQAKNTYENAWYSWSIMSNHGWNKALVVTTPYHTQRVASCFSEYPVEIHLIPASLPPDYSWFYKLYRVMYEYAAITYYALKGLLCRC